MLYRKAINNLIAWKEHKSNQGLLVVGARQVGKSTLIEEFAHQHYEVLAKIDFIATPHAVDVIRQARDADDLFLRISALTDKELVPGRTLVFFDEIQEFEDILTWAKYLQARSEFDYVFSGSLLGVDLSGVRSWPVGFLDEMEMFPLDFEEFCLANGVTASVLQEVRAAYSECRPVADFIHDKMLDLHRKYLLVGGMPEAVQRFLDTNDMNALRRAHKGVYDMYEHDIARHMKDNEAIRFVKMLYEAIPSQLDKENKRFKFAGLKGAGVVHEGDLRFSRLESSFDWLEATGVALSALRVTEPCFPLGLTADRGTFKLYMNDVGLLTYRLAGTAALEILAGRGDINYGSIYENFVAQELRSCELDLYYYNSTKRGEVDFVIQDSARGKVLLIEVKSGKDYKRHRALKNLLQVDDYEIDGAYVLCNGNLEEDDGVLYLPIYMTSFIGRDAAAQPVTEPVGAQ